MKPPCEPTCRTGLVRHRPMIEPPLARCRDSSKGAVYLLVMWLGALTWVWVWVSTATPTGATEANPSFGDQLTWSAPRQCAGHNDVVARIDALTSASRADVRADAAVTPRGNGWAVELTIASPSGQSRHTLTADDCETLVEAVSLIIAVHLDPAAGASSPSGGHESTEAVSRGVTGRSEVGVRERPSMSGTGRTRTRTRSASDPSRSVLDDLANDREPERRAQRAGRRPDRVARRAARRAQRRSPLVAASALAGVGAGLLPQLDLGAGVLAAIVYPQARFEVSGQHWFPRRATIDDHSRAGADIDAWTMTLRGCPVITGDSDARWELPLCVAVDGGWLRARPVGLVDGEQGRGPWFAAGVSPRFHWRARPWVSLWMGADAFAVITAPRFRALGLPEGADVFHQSRPLGARVVAGLEFRLGARAGP